MHVDRKVRQYELDADVVEAIDTLYVASGGLLRRDVVQQAVRLLAEIYRVSPEDAVDLIRDGTMLRVVVHRVGTKNDEMKE